MIGKKILENAETIIGNDGTESFVPNANIFLAAAIAAVIIIPVFAAILSIKKKAKE